MISFWFLLTFSGGYAGIKEYEDFFSNFIFCLFQKTSTKPDGRFYEMAFDQTTYLWLRIAFITIKSPF
jgi:hypothetical protein